jgi:hypothetical protein
MVFNHVATFSSRQKANIVMWQHILRLFAYATPMSRYDRPSHRVYVVLSFFSRKGWQVQFLEADLKPSLPGRLRLQIQRRSASWHDGGKPWGTSEARQMLEYAIQVGRGGCYLRLTPEQNRKLKRSYSRLAHSPLI